MNPIKLADTTVSQHTIFLRTYIAKIRVMTAFESRTRTSKSDAADLARLCFRSQMCTEVPPDDRRIFAQLNGLA